jgi:hypothetical protein
LFNFAGTCRWRNAVSWRTAGSSSSSDTATNLGKHEPKFLVIFMGVKVSYGVGLKSGQVSSSPSLYLCNPVPESTLSPSQGLRIWPLVIKTHSQDTPMHLYFSHLPDDAHRAVLGSIQGRQLSRFLFAYNILCSRGPGLDPPECVYNEWILIISRVCRVDMAIAGENESNLIFDPLERRGD